MADIYFDVVKGKEDEVTALPERSTDGSAGYDFIALEDVFVPSMWVENAWSNQDTVTIAPTGVKAKFPENVVLKLFSRSSLAVKKGLFLVNGTGIIDSDYFENEDNDGEIMFAFRNVSRNHVVIKKGDKIGQGIFEPFLLTTDDDTKGKERKGGIGSTGE